MTLEQGGKTYTGNIDFIAPTLDAKTDTLFVRAKFANESAALVIGSYAQLTLGGFSYKNAALIPEYALVKTAESVVVYVIGEEGVVSMRPVEVAQVKDGNATVLSGLNAGEKIVVSNIAKLRPNTKVSIIGGE